ncbi:polysaccharide deacetylase family protein [Methylobacterium oxalidis]|uniref:polysaccharide deacetylase family protein n=1 Tax=Methylobacterium oxalidis TaxID=944322 RepID=UPI0033155F0A
MSSAIKPSRWILKKAARLGVASLSAPKALVPRVIGSEPVFRVLTYHRFGPCHRMPFSLDLKTFERQIRYLAEQKLAASLSDLERYAGGGLHIDRNRVLVTIDDGDPSVFEIALPILRQYGIPAVAFVLPAAVPGFPAMTNAQLRELAANGVAIGSHSVNHRSMARISAHEAAHEAQESRDRLEQALGEPVRAFAYPFGTRSDVSPEAAHAVQSAGYTLAFTSLHGPVRPGVEPLMIPRIKIESGDPDWMFPAICGGSLDLWRIVDTVLPMLQRPQRVVYP